MKWLAEICRVKQDLRKGKAVTVKKARCREIAQCKDGSGVPGGVIGPCALLVVQLRFDSELLSSQNKVGNAISNKNHKIIKNKRALQEKQNFSWNFLFYSFQEALCDVRDKIFIISLTKTIGGFKGLFSECVTQCAKGGTQK